MKRKVEIEEQDNNRYVVSGYVKLDGGWFGDRLVRQDAWRRNYTEMEMSKTAAIETTQEFFKMSDEQVNRLVGR